MKRTALRKKGISPFSKLQQELWEECKRITRDQYGNSCYTCPATELSGKNWHTGHLWPKGSLHALLKYDIRILRPQCYNCNMNLGGQGAIFYKRMLKEEGKEYMNILEADKLKDKRDYLNAATHYTKLLEEYKSLKK